MKKGIENLGRPILKYKKMEFEYYVENDRLYFETSSLNFDKIVRLVQDGDATYLGNKTIRCYVETLLHDIDRTLSVRKLKKILSNKIKAYIERKVFR